LYSSPDIVRQIKSRRMRWAGHVACMGKGKWCESPKERAHLNERPRCRWEDGIKLDLREIGWGGGGVEWIHLAQDRDCWWAVVNVVMSFWVLAPWSELVTY
jgi:hypothetical protein